jgi:hypothetical protein
MNKRQGMYVINATTIGSKIVQQSDINWSKRILGNEALTHMKTNIITQALNPIIIADTTVSFTGPYSLKIIKSKFLPFSVKYK